MIFLKLVALFYELLGWFIILGIVYLIWCFLKCLVSTYWKHWTKGAKHGGKEG